MAIIDGVPAIEVTIWIGGRPAFEYADPDHNQEPDENGTKMSSKYIESRCGEEFTIHVRINPTYDHHQPIPHTLNLAAYTDGQWIRGELCRQNNLHDGPFRVDIKERVTKARDGTVFKQAFKFAGVATVDDSSSWRLENEREKVRELGVIELRVFRVQELGTSDFKGNSETSRLAEVSEKSLKGRAVSHGTQFGDDVQRSPPGANILPRYRDVKRLPTDTGPLATYRFTVFAKRPSSRESKTRLSAKQSPSRRGEVLNQASPAAAPAAALSHAERVQEDMRQQAIARLRGFGDQFRGHRDRARARVQRGQRGHAGQQPHIKEERRKKEEGVT
ncbi:hypothetical protein PG994_002007 [Apiospora phragmitis]|uniref:DUF7918 domain-containing protein n=1 Tax=Apiospora phragmitis TaxID=2905665 RepID=A0ABR1WV49_9PEZI